MKNPNRSFNVAKLLFYCLNREEVTQVKLAKKLGMSTPQQLSNVLEGRCQLPTKYIPKLIKAGPFPEDDILDAYVADYELWLKSYL